MSSSLVLWAPETRLGSARPNSITEGLHNKMELISRRAFGFRNFKNYRLRVKALCG